MTSRSSSVRWLGALAALCFLAAHLPFLVWFLDDIDPINFAMGVRHYDIALHQPHPPGYPILILLGKIAVWAMTTVGWHPPGDIEAGAIAIWGMLAGALAAFPLLTLFAQIEPPAPDAAPVPLWRSRAAWAMALTLACPLFWFTAARPLSDVPGLAAALLSLAVLARAFAAQGGWGRRMADATGASGEAVGSAEIVASGKLIVLGALLAGLAIGLRSQTFWLTLPVLGLVIADRAGRGAAGALLGSLMTFGIGALAWFVPMVIATGGPAAYWQALYSQGSEDFGGVDMLWTSAQPLPRLLYNLIQTFLAPWASVPLALVVLALAAVGLGVMLVRARRGLVLLAVMTLPYAALHLLFHENETIRYALPLVVPVVYLAVRGLEALLRRASFAGAALLVAASLAIGAPALQAYAKGTSPIFQLFDDLNRAPVDAARRPVVAMHRRVFNESRRARQWDGPAFAWTLLPSTRAYEWLEVAKYWRDGQDTPVWFLADPRRTDLALIDAAARAHVRRYRWPLVDAGDPLSQFLLRKLPQAFDDPALIGGARPDEMDWYVFDRPGWFLEEGWALTPETSGVADADHKGPGVAPIVGHIRRRPEETRLLIGGRNLGAAGAPTVRFTAAIDGRVLDTWDILPDPGFFLKAITLPAGALAGDGAYARLTVQAQAVDASGAVVGGPQSPATPQAAATAPASAAASATPGAAAASAGGVAAAPGTATAPAAASPAAATTASTAGAATGPAAATAPATAAVPAAAAIEQFDLQAASAVMFGFDTGWHEAEYQPKSGLAWRWSSAAAALRVWNAGRDVTLRLKAESPLRYFDAAPTVTVKAGTRVLTTFQADGDIDLTLDVSAAVLAEGGGALVLTTDRTFSPAERQAGVTDRRRLGLRVFDVSIAERSWGVLAPPAATGAQR